MKASAILKSSDQEFHLSAKVTTIGASGCGINIQANGVETQHATIEVSREDGGLILRDLDTESGTRVNNCLVQNAAVRIVHGDRLRFGDATFELLMVTHAPASAMTTNSTLAARGSGGLIRGSRISRPVSAAPTLPRPPSITPTASAQHASATTSQLPSATVNLELQRRLAQAESAATAAKEETAGLKAQLQRLIGERSSDAATRHEESEARAAELASARRLADSARRDAEISGCLAGQLREDLAARDSTVSRLCRDIDTLKEEAKSKDLVISALQAKFLRYRDAKHSAEEWAEREKELDWLRRRLRDAETQTRDLVANSARQAEELESARTLAAGEEAARLATRQELVEALARCSEALSAEAAAREMAESSGRSLAALRSRLTSALLAELANNGEVADDDKLAEAAKRLVTERGDLARRVGQLGERLRAAEATLTNHATAVQKYRSKLEASANRLAASPGRTASRLRDELAALTAEPVGEPILQPVKDARLLDLQAQLRWEAGIEAALARCLGCCDAAGDCEQEVSQEVVDCSPIELAQRLHARWRESGADGAKLRAELLEAEGRARRDCQALEERVAVEVARREAALGHLAELQGRISDLIQARQTEETRRLTDAQSAAERHAGWESREAALRREAEESRAELARLATEAEERERAAAARHEAATAALREEARQRGEALAHMEERINKMTRQARELQDQLDQHRLAAETAQAEAESARARQAEAEALAQRPAEQAAQLERALAAVQQENSALKQAARDQRIEAEALRRDLQGATARLTDIRGELTDAQKAELETTRRRVRELTAQLAEAREAARSASAATAVVEAASAASAAARAEVADWRARFEAEAAARRDTEAELRRAKAVAAEAEAASAASAQRGRSIEAELSATGQQCRGERHADVIAHQKEALSELRRRVKEVERLRPPVPSHDQAVQQVVLLKKELAELRAKQALLETDRFPRPISGDAAPEKPPSPPTPAVTQADLDMERTAHRETLDSLELSELTYTSLLRAVASNLDLDKVQGLRSMAHLPRDERQKLAREREETVAQLSHRLRLFNDRLTRKDELLVGCEQDMSRLKQAEELAQKRGAQVESLTEELRNRTEETQLLRESLSRTKDVLNKEKRLNTAIKQKKTFHLEQQPTVQRPKQEQDQQQVEFHCPPEDVFGKEEARKRSIREKIRRKDYEIKTLKAELISKEKNLGTAAERLANLESTLGLPHESELTPENLVS